MPDPRDFLPQPPWEGPPLPRGIVPGNPDTREEKAMPEIERHYGMVVAVGGINTKTLNLPDWELSYVEYPPGQMKEFRGALMRAHISIVRVTDMRIYFEQ